MQRHAAALGLGMLLGGLGVGLIRPNPVAAERADKKDAPAADGKVGYIHMPRVLWEAARAKTHGKALAGLRRSYDEKIAAARTKVEPASAGAANPEADALEAEARRELDGRQDRLLGEMYQDVAVVAADLAKDYGLDAVQTYPVPPGTVDIRLMKGLLGAPSALLYVTRDADLTTEMIRRLDKRYEAAGGE